MGRRWLNEGHDKGEYQRLVGDEEEEEDKVGVVAASSDECRMRELGYKQELRRSLSLIANFSLTFSIISVLTGITTMFGTGLTFGGPSTMIYGWAFVGTMTLLVGSSLAEICSSYPTSGGLYFWSYRLCGHEWGPLASWFTGWFEVVDTAEGTKAKWDTMLILFDFSAV